MVRLLVMEDLSQVAHVEGLAALGADHEMLRFPCGFAANSHARLDAMQLRLDFIAVHALRTRQQKARCTRE